MTPITIKAETFSRCRDATADLVQARQAVGEVFTRISPIRKVGSQFECTVNFVKDPDHV